MANSSGKPSSKVLLQDSKASKISTGKNLTRSQPGTPNALEVKSVRFEENEEP